MGNERKEPSPENYIDLIIDDLAQEAHKAGYTGTDVDGYISNAMHKSGLEILKKTTERLNCEPEVTDNPQNEDRS